MGTRISNPSRCCSLRFPIILYPFGKKVKQGAIVWKQVYACLHVRHTDVLQACSKRELHVAASQDSDLFKFLSPYYIGYLDTNYKY